MQRCVGDIEIISTHYSHASITCPIAVENVVLMGNRDSHNAQPY